MSLKLSEAIVLASTLGPQIKGEYFNPETSGTCVLGGVKEVVGAKDMKSVYDLFPTLGDFMGAERQPNTHRRTVAGQIMQFNDRHGLSREAIAEWVVRGGHDCEMVVQEHIQEKQLVTQ